MIIHLVVSSFVQELFSFPIRVMDARLVKYTNTIAQPRSALVTNTMSAMNGCTFPSAL